MISRQDADPSRSPPPTEGESFRPLVYGEALFDRFPDGTRVPGGAPFNVAWHLRGFGADPLLVSRVGADLPGDEIRRRMEAWEMDFQGVQLHPHRPTGQVRAELEGGEPRFRIEARQAYDEIETHHLPSPSVLSEVQLLYHGTLALREDLSRGTLSHLRDTLPCPVLVDVNLRDPWWTRVVVARVLSGVRCVKLNRDEAALLADAPVESREELVAAAGRLRKLHGIGTVVVTLGAEGALGAGDSGPVWEEASRVGDLRDTVGAGDAFSAVLALGTHHHWPLALTLRRASDFAADLCGVQGATQEDLSLYHRHRRRWNHGR